MAIEARRTLLQTVRADTRAAVVMQCARLAAVTALAIRS
jgi:hypothetical protein